MSTHNIHFVFLFTFTVFLMYNLQCFIHYIIHTSATSAAYTMRKHDVHLSIFLYRFYGRKKSTVSLLCVGQKWKNSFNLDTFSNIIRFALMGFGWQIPIWKCDRKKRINTYIPLNVLTKFYQFKFHHHILWYSKYKKKKWIHVFGFVDWIGLILVTSMILLYFIMHIGAPIYVYTNDSPKKNSHSLTTSNKLNMLCLS